MLEYIIQFILHINVHLTAITNAYGMWTYGILFLIIFCETGLVVTPFLPGDSLLFATGALAAQPGSLLNPHYLVLLLIVAVICGDTSNFFIGRTVGPRVFRMEDSLLLNKKHIQRTHDFFERYGLKTIIIARFIPIVRTFTPFVAGVGQMPYKRFIRFCLLGAVIWIAGFIYISYWFGNIPIVKNNFSIVIMVIILLSMTPPIVEFLRHRLKTD